MDHSEKPVVIGPIEALELTIEMLNSVVDPPEDITAFMSDYEFAQEAQKVCEQASINLENLRAYLQEFYEEAEAEYELEPSSEVLH
jgi:hypothetical protein